MTRQRLSRRDVLVGAGSACAAATASHAQTWALASVLVASKQSATSRAATVANGEARFPVEEATIAGIHAAYLAGQTTARAITQSYLDRIAANDKRGPYLNAIITVSPHALVEADRLDAALTATGSLTGPLHGIPVVLKDNIDTFDTPTTSGVALFRDFVPPKDASIVARLRRAGAIVVAKASLSELALGIQDNINSVLGGFTRNPYDTAYASGGSSGGSGVAVAANFATVGPERVRAGRTVSEDLVFSMGYGTDLPVDKVSSGWFRGQSFKILSRSARPLPSE